MNEAEIYIRNDPNERAARVALATAIALAWTLAMIGLGYWYCWNQLMGVEF